MTAPPFRLEVGRRTDVGAVRKANEDSLYADLERGLWMVADGMGGLENGRWASNALVEAVCATSLSGDFDADVASVSSALHAANATVWQAAQAAGKPMGSTVVALLLRDRRFAVLWAGDSRAYLLRGGELLQLTRDHSQVQDLVERGILSAEEARGHPMSHVLSRAVGVQESLEVDAIADEAEVRDVFMLCSDGLTGVVSDAEIAEQIARAKPAAACEALVQLCLARGAPDNVTVILIACAEITQLVLA